jgi:hypothetical protein
MAFLALPVYGGNNNVAIQFGILIICVLIDSKYVISTFNFQVSHTSDANVAYIDGSECFYIRKITELIGVTVRLTF